MMELHGPVLVFGGPYSNLQATRAVLAEAKARNIAASNIICTGDVVAYCADPVATLDLVEQAGIHCIMGNCEESLSVGADDCGCGFAPGTACDRLSADWYGFANAVLGPKHRAFMANMPKRLDFKLNGVKLTVVHGGAKIINRFIFASTPERVKTAEIRELGSVDGVIAGHSGMPFSQVIEGKLWHNAGVVGMPANDGTPRVWFSVLTPGAASGELLIQHHELSYDHAAAAKAMRDAGLLEDYANALATGLWPSCDVLPAWEAKAQGKAMPEGGIFFSKKGRAEGLAANWPISAHPADLPEDKFTDSDFTAKGEHRAKIALNTLETLWINTGTLCNLTCENCYIESSPRNDRLVYITAAEVAAFLDEAQVMGTGEIGFTGGEPFMNPQIIAMLEDSLSRGFKTLVLTNAMKPMMRLKKPLLDLHQRYGALLTLRVSVDHYAQDLHELERGPRTWKPTLDGLKFVADHGITTHIAGRMYSGEPESAVRGGYANLFAEIGLQLDANNPHELLLFPEMDAHVDVPEITESCWGILGLSPNAIMCASSRMVVKRKGAHKPAVIACTLLPYEPAFELGETLAEAKGPVPLNHPHCAKFCVLGGASCSK